MDKLPDGLKDLRFMLWLFAGDIVNQTKRKLDKMGCNVFCSVSGI